MVDRLQGGFSMALNVDRLEGEVLKLSPVLRARLAARALLAAAVRLRGGPAW